MVDIDRLMKGLECHAQSAHLNYCSECPYQDSEDEDENGDYEGECTWLLAKDALELLNEQANAYHYLQKQFFEVQNELLSQPHKTVNTWKHLWDAPDGSFKGRCENCGFVHFFVEGHDSQYRFCPSCGERKVV